MAWMKVKPGVKPRSLTIMAAVGNIAQHLQLPADVVVTSGNDSKHRIDSKHYSGEALDVRTRTFPTTESKALFVTLVLQRLGRGYQGFLEDVGGPNEHAHFEYDPTPGK